MAHVNEIVRDRIVRGLELAIAGKQKSIFNMPWLNGRPQNIATKHIYSGINPFLLGIVAEENGYGSPYWITENEMVKQGGRVSKEVYFDREKHGIVVFSGNVKKSKKVLETQAEDLKKTYYMLRFYKVFNIDTVTGIEFDLPEKLTGNVPQGDEVINDYKENTGIAMVNGGNKACYSVGLDTIKLPSKELFKSLEGYYSTVFHEMVHSTGHESRLKRFDKDAQSAFGSESYSKEELVAELGASFLMNYCKMDNEDQSVAYLKGWLKPLKDDPQLIIGASSQAQKAYDYILGGE